LETKAEGSRERGGLKGQKKKETERFATLKMVGARIRQKKRPVRILVSGVPSLFSCRKKVRRQKKGK